MKTVIAAVAVSAMLLSQACRSTGMPNAAETPAAVNEGVGEAGTVTIRAWVDAIDKTNQTVTLKGPRGGTVTLEVKDPRRLDTMAVGDPIVAAYREALVLRTKRMPGAAAGLITREARSTAGSGNAPAASVGRQVVATATIEAIDRTAQTVTVKWPRGNSETIKVKDGASLQGVDTGDLAELTYTQALAITLDRAGL